MTQQLSRATDPGVAGVPAVPSAARLDPRDVATALRVLDAVPDLPGAGPSGGHPPAAASG